MTREKIVEIARLFTKARSQFVISDVQAAELAVQAGLDFSESTRGVWTHIEITTDGSSRTIELPDGYYRAESVFYRRGNNSYLSDPLAEAQLSDLLDPVNDYYSDGYPRAFAVTKSDAAPVLVLDTTPADGKLILYYRGRLAWDPDPLVDASVPQILEEFHMGITYRLAAYIAEIIEDPAKQASNLVLFEQKVNAYASHDRQPGGQRIDQAPARGVAAQGPAVGPHGERRGQYDRDSPGAVRTGPAWAPGTSRPRLQPPPSRAQTS